MDHRLVLPFLRLLSFLNIHPSSRSSTCGTRIRFVLRGRQQERGHHQGKASLPLARSLTPARDDMSIAREPGDLLCWRRSPEILASLDMSTSTDGNISVHFDLLEPGPT